MKTIAISMRIVEASSYKEVRDAIAHDWLTFFSNYYPDITIILIPNNLHAAQNTLKNINFDGLILSGGNDINEYSERDEVEELLLNHFQKLQLPILGVCRGFQFLLSQHGASLSRISNHSNTMHNVHFQKNSLLAGEVRKVNSFHNWKIDKLPEEYLCIALSADGCIEAAKHKKEKLYGIMWHPERGSHLEVNKTILNMVFDI